MSVQSWRESEKEVHLTRTIIKFCMLLAIFGGGVGVCAVAEAAVPIIAFADHLTDGEITLLYDPADGRMALEADHRRIVSFEVVSTSGILTGVTPDLVLPPFDVHTPTKFFILKTDGIGETDFGPIAEPGLSPAMLADDLTLNGSKTAASLGNPNLAFVPEPGGSSLISLGSIGLLWARHRRR